jgi:hypothetical protein
MPSTFVEGPGTAAREGIPNEMKLLSCAMDGLQKELSDLVGRLAPITRPVPTVGSPSEEQPNGTDEVSDVRKEIMLCLSRIRLMSQIVAILNKRVDL